MNSFQDRWLCLAAPSLGFYLMVVFSSLRCLFPSSLQSHADGSWHEATTKHRSVWWARGQGHRDGWSSLTSRHQPASLQGQGNEAVALLQFSGGKLSPDVAGEGGKWKWR